MKNYISKITIFAVICLAFLSFFATASAQMVPQVQTYAATNILNNQATLNGYLNLNGSYNNYIWFQWGPDTNYGSQTTQQIINYTGSFSQNITGLNSYTTYHFRAVVQSSNGTFYGQDMTFQSNYGNNYNNGNFYVQTTYPTYLQNSSATLNGTLTCNNNYSNSYTCNSNGAIVWFQWGPDTNYGSTSFQQSISSGTFMQQIANLNYNTTYHFRAVANVNGQIMYGQDMTFNTNGSNNNNYYGYNGSGNLIVTKKVMNLSSGNLNWQTVVNAAPGDVLSFSIILQANSGQDIHNVFLRDILPANLIYTGNTTINSITNYNNPVNGINVGTVPANGSEVVTYQAQVASASNFTYGTTTLSNSATVTSNESGTQTASASVIVNNSLVYGAATVSGASTVSTGLTNNPITDSFAFPLFFIILGAWLYFSGKIYKFSDWLAAKIKR